MGKTQPKVSGRDGSEKGAASTGGAFEAGKTMGQTKAARVVQGRGLGEKMVTNNPYAHETKFTNN